MENLIRNIASTRTGTIVKSFKVEHPTCNREIQSKKTKLSKKVEKTYKVTVTYIQINEEEAKIKRAMIESILKKVYCR